MPDTENPPKRQAGGGDVGVYAMRDRAASERKAIGSINLRRN